MGKQPISGGKKLEDIWGRNATSLHIKTKMPRDKAELGWRERGRRGADFALNWFTVDKPVLRAARAHEGGRAMMHSVFGVEDDNGYLFAKRSLAELGRPVVGHPSQSGATDERPLSHREGKVK